ncbi:MAG TPA: endolytic transglycosylase MltG [Chitinophagaceae bacterium]|nr:endolytic transglycosylase MltG [Chitinophagaceae bacterium]
MPAKKTGKATAKKWVLWGIAGILIAAIYFGILFFGPNTGNFRGHTYFFIHTGSDYSEVVSGLSGQGIIKNRGSFDWLARHLDYPQHIHAGRYRILQGMSDFSIVRMLRSGRQTPVRLVINKLRTKSDLIQWLTAYLEPDALTWSTRLGNPDFLKPFGLDTNTVMCMVIPDTYEIYWNSSPGQVFKKFYQAYQSFWTPRRRQLAAIHGLSPCQVTILASIVDEETNHSRDKPWIAGVYLNRLNRGMPLSSDPTVKFAMDDFSIRRVYTKYTQYPSPYNTYLHAGLPPGPICTPSTQSIEAVLHSQPSDYLYFCARPDFTGYLVFAATWAEHEKNARRYQHFLDSLHLK